MQSLGKGATPGAVWYYGQVFFTSQLGDYNRQMVRLTKSAFINPKSDHAIFVKKPPKPDEKPKEYEEWKKTHANVVGVGKG